MSAAVNVLVTLARANAVSGVTATLPRMSAMPLAPVQVVPSGKMTVTDTPGIANFARMRSSRSAIATRMAGVALGPRGGRGWRRIDETGIWSVGSGVGVAGLWMVSGSRWASDADGVAWGSGPVRRWADRTGPSVRVSAGTTTIASRNGKASRIAVRRGRDGTMPAAR